MKSILLRVAKRLSYLEDAGCPKVNMGSAGLNDLIISPRKNRSKRHHHHPHAFWFTIY